MRGGERGEEVRVCRILCMSFIAHVMCSMSPCRGGGGGVRARASWCPCMSSERSRARGGGRGMCMCLMFKVSRRFPWWGYAHYVNSFPSMSGYVHPVCVCIVLNFKSIAGNEKLKKKLKLSGALHGQRVEEGYHTLCRRYLAGMYGMFG